MSSGIIVQSQSHQAAFERFASGSKKSMVALVKGEFGIVLDKVARYTPPASEGVTGLKAERQGKAKVAADIRSIYGTPGDAYDAIKGTSAASASAFWFLHKQGNDDDASKIVRAATGKSFSSFDGGTLHQRVSPAQRRKRRKEIVFFVRNPQSLESYIQQEESHVWWLASGWAPALRALGRKLPYGVGKANGPGNFRAIINDRRIELIATDEVGYASNVRDINRRIAWAMQVRTQDLNDMWDKYLATLARETGFKSAKK
ncbi:hypothetical protein [Prosthecobacter dejongeii]|uniref:Uncharacterized protein n=1 Tax=Prosthecobacter dejongeii TaxID=48465 RepID=A0A7W8DQ23_9BACT|nr:hypothetical protein [Prosthecobacter dejongeii]MBB5038269.1 hypothetical protein [Prosthecobacter dejongeii]